MAPVPHADQAIVDRGKVSGYLLSSNHPVGRTKAAFFTRFGFREDAPDQLAQAPLDHIVSHDVANSEVSSYGIKYRIDGPLASPDGAQSTCEFRLDRPCWRGGTTLHNGFSVLM